MKTTRGLVLSLFAMITFVAAQAQTINFVVALRVANYQQTGFNTAAYSSSRMEVNVQGSDMNLLTGAKTFGYPTAQSQGLIYDTDDGGKYTLTGTITNQFSSIANLNTAFGQGSYSLTASGVTVPFTVGSDDYAMAPKGSLVLTSDGVTTVGTWVGNTLMLTAAEAAQALTFKTTTFSPSGGLYASTAFLERESPYQVLFDDFQFSGAVSYTEDLTAGQLVAGATYHAEIESVNLIIRDTTSISGANVVAGFSSTTTFNVQVIPEPTTYAAIFGAIALAGVMLHRRQRRMA